MSGINDTSGANVGKAGLTQGLPSNATGQDIQEELMFLLAVGNNILTTSVNIQQQTAQKMQQS